MFFERVDILKSCERNVSKKSDYFIYNPSLNARNAFLYPICVGHFFYEPGYHLIRNSFDSFLLIYIQHGSMHFHIGDYSYDAYEGQFVFLDCYAPHSYFADKDCEIIWLHFDGLSTRTYYKIIFDKLGNVFTLSNSYPILNKINTIYRQFYSNAHIDELIMNKLITDILTELGIQQPVATVSANANSDYVVQKTIAYITEHLSGDLSIDTLASSVSLSTYHFIRIFKKGTGFTPHEYIVNTKVSNAKFLLKNTNIPIKEICFGCGFSSESIFSTTFKKQTGFSPSAYRLSDTV